MSEWLVFATEAAAKSAVTQIDVKIGVTIKGRNAATKKVDDRAMGTERWAVPLQRATDGKWVFPRCPDADPSRPFAVEAYDPSWFPQAPA